MLISVYDIFVYIDLQCVNIGTHRHAGYQPTQTPETGTELRNYATCNTKHKQRDHA